MGYYGKLLEDDGRYVSLDSCDVSEGQVVEVSSIVGNTITSRFVRLQGRALKIELTGLAAGHYIVYLVNRRGYRHRLGIFSREIRSERP